MINEKGLRIYRKLISYSENQTKIHINSKDGFRNGFIIDLNEQRLTLVLKDDVLGETTPILLEDIYEDSIKKFKKVER